VGQSKIVSTHPRAGFVVPASAPVSATARPELISRRTATLLFAVFILYTGLAEIYKASRKPFWFDETLTVLVAARQTLPAIEATLRTAADGNPPLFYYLETLTSRAVSNPQIGYRLNSIAGVLCMSVCAFIFARRRTRLASSRTQSRDSGLSEPLNRS